MPEHRSVAAVRLEHVVGEPVGEVARIGEIDTEHWFAGSGEMPTARSVVEHTRLLLEPDYPY